jgi:hypothetical protein
MALEIDTLIGDGGQRSTGAWVEYPDDDGVAFQLTYLQNNSYQDFVSERMMKARKGRREVPSDKARAIVNVALQRFIIKGWRGLTSGGQPFEFTPENVKKVLEQSPVLRSWIIEEANNLENFGGGEKEDESPNGDIKSGPAVEP